MLNWFSERWNDFLNLCLSFLLSLFDLLVDLICFTFESIFNSVVALFNTLGGVFSSFGITQYLSMLPQSMLNVMSIVGVNDVSSIIVSAVIVRFLLQLIPFVRLGS